MLSLGIDETKLPFLMIVDYRTEVPSAFVYEKSECEGSSFNVVIEDHQFISDFVNSYF